MFFWHYYYGKSKNELKLKHVKKGIKNSLSDKEELSKFRGRNIVIPVTAKRVDRIQEIHIFVGHSICESLEKAL